jgi:hypothetical protein
MEATNIRETKTGYFDPFEITLKVENEKELAALYFLFNHVCFEDLLDEDQCTNIRSKISNINPCATAISHKFICYDSFPNKSK